jgi:hypothetical protein
MTVTQHPFDGLTHQPGTIVPADLDEASPSDSPQSYSDNQRGLRLVAPLDPATLSSSHETEQPHSLHALSIAGTRRDPVFQLLAGLTATNLNAQVAIVSLVDEDRMWYQAMFGAAGTTNPAPGLSCDWVVYRGSFFEVPDVASDARFADGAVARAGLNSYAGTPIFGVDGQPAGSLVVLNLQPRRLTRDERRRLQQMAELVTGQLQLRRAHRDETWADAMDDGPDQTTLAMLDARTSSYDALARWKHRTGEQLPDAALRDIAQRDELVLDLDRSVLDSSCQGDVDILDDVRVTLEDNVQEDTAASADVHDLVFAHIETAATNVMSRLRRLGFSTVMVDMGNHESPVRNTTLSPKGDPLVPRPVPTRTRAARSRPSAASGRPTSCARNPRWTRLVAGAARRNTGNQGSSKTNLPL